MAAQEPQNPPSGPSAPQGGGQPTSPGSQTPGPVPGGTGGQTPVQTPPSPGGGQPTPGAPTGGPTPQPTPPGGGQPTTPGQGGQTPPAPGGTPLREVPQQPGGGQPQPGTGDSGGQTPQGGTGEESGGSESPSQGGEGSSGPQKKTSEKDDSSDAEEDIIAPKPKEGEPWDVIIIGSGPAGLTAAVYTTRAALSTLIIGGSKWGGQLMLTTEVENYPGFRSILGPDLMMKMRKHATAFGAEFIERDVESVDFKNRPFTVRADGKEYKARSVILASGAETKWLGLPSEQKYIGKGVSSCAPCDAPFFRGKKVIVVGGGDSAMEEASVLSKYAESVAIVHRRDEFKASEAMQQRIFSDPKVKVYWDTEVKEVLGSEKVSGVQLTSKTAGGGKIKSKTNGKHEEKTSEELGGKKVSEEGENVVWELPIEGMFVAIGHTPATKLYGDQIELDKKGYVVVHDHTRTNIAGVYVAGDVHDWHYRQAVTAAGFGCMAAMDTEKWLEEQKAEEKEREKEKKEEKK